MSKKIGSALHHVAGGTVFGYANAEIIGEGGKRQHVERRINPDESAIVQRIFDMAARGSGFKKIAKRLNYDRVPSARPRRDGRPRSWTPSSRMLKNPTFDVGPA
jgi:Recombinase